MSSLKQAQGQYHCGSFQYTGWAVHMNQLNQPRQYLSLRKLKRLTPLWEGLCSPLSVYFSIFLSPPLLLLDTFNKTCFYVKKKKENWRQDGSTPHWNSWLEGVKGERFPKHLFKGISWSNIFHWFTFLGSLYWASAMCQALTSGQNKRHLPSGNDKTIWEKQHIFNYSK